MTATDATDAPAGASATDATATADLDADAAAAVEQFGFFAAEVVRSRRLGPTMTRITLGGPGLDGFASGGRDQSFSLFLPHPGQDAPVLPVEAGAGWFAEWRALDESVRAVMRSYTVRSQRELPGGGTELDVDFALHGDTGPASRWAARAEPGDRVLLLGPAVADNRSVGFRPPAGTRTVLVAADETALPAAAAILEWLPEDVTVHAFLQVPHAEDVQELPARAADGTRWLVGTDLLVGAVRAAEFPVDGEDRVYAWLAGEAGTVRALRRHLVGERGVDRRRIEFSGYWRRGASEEDLRAEALAAYESAPAEGAQEA
ncbi:siderophore-interacting protein [Kitasatospora sp. NBC_00458]|uniref:siderophore-interacting protein n=1 Tax=Kitasatospora sp. NBC_00458 TaxID=2903568 RepID=UPI002E18B474